MPHTVIDLVILACSLSEESQPFDKTVGAGLTTSELQFSTALETLNSMTFLCWVCQLSLPWFKQVWPRSCRIFPWGFSQILSWSTSIYRHKTIRCTQSILYYRRTSHSICQQKLHPVKLPVYQNIRHPAATTTVARHQRCIQQHKLHPAWTGNETRTHARIPTSMVGKLHQQPTTLLCFENMLNNPKPFGCSLPQRSPAPPVLFLNLPNAILKVNKQSLRETNVS